MQSEKYNQTYDLAFDMHSLDKITENIYVVVGDVFLLEMLSPLIQVKNNLVFEFVYLFDV